jgi:hypothetical protein
MVYQQLLCRRRSAHITPERSNQASRPSPRDPRRSATLGLSGGYRQGNVVEQAVARLKQDWAHGDRYGSWPSAITPSWY